MNYNLKSKEIVWGQYTCLAAIDQDGILYLGTPSIEKLNDWQKDLCRKKLGSKSFKAFAGESFNIGKLISKTESDRYGKVAFYPFDTTVLTLFRWEAKVNKNPKTIDVLVDGFGDSFRSLAYGQLGIELSDELRQAWLTLRQGTIDTFKPLTKQLQEHGFDNSCPQKAYWAYIGNMQKALGIVSGTRDEQGNDQLGKLLEAQAILTAYMNVGQLPWDAYRKWMSGLNKI